jgi:hypothetical protein
MNIDFCFSDSSTGAVIGMIFQLLWPPTGCVFPIGVANRGYQLPVARSSVTRDEKFLG